MAIAGTLLGTTVVLALEMQRNVTLRIDEATLGEDLQFTLDWIARTLRSAGSNPYAIGPALCAAPVFQPVRIDPDGNGKNDDVRIHADIYPPNGLLGGGSIWCDEAGEDVTIALDRRAMAITRQDNNVDARPVPMTDASIIDLQFSYFDDIGNPTENANLVTSVYVTIIGTSQPASADATTRRRLTTSVVDTEVRIRVR
jgi:Tfp pilus assembly protein PilW